LFYSPRRKCFHYIFAKATILLCRLGVAWSYSNGQRRHVRELTRSSKTDFNGAGGLRNHICFVTFEFEIPDGIPAVLTERAHEKSNHKSVNLAGGADDVDGVALRNQLDWPGAYWVLGRRTVSVPNYECCTRSR
jgi:hypothetical protein